MGYYRVDGPYRPRSFGGFSFFPPVIKLLLIVNAAVLLLAGFILAPFTIAGVPIGGGRGLIIYYLALWPIGTNFWPWQLVTYMFLHGDFWHLFFNMLAVWMFGIELENIWGSKRFLIYYLLCGLGGAFANLVVAPMLGQVGPTVGASGAVFGVLIAFGMLFPDRPIYIYFLLPVKAKYLIMVYIGFELFYGVTGTSDGVAHFAHLGGAAVGLVYMLGELGLLPMRAWWDLFRGELKNPFSDNQTVHKGGQSKDARFYDIRSGKPLNSDHEVSQEVIDAILDKISTGGYQSLTDEEKRILNDASKKIH